MSWMLLITLAMVTFFNRYIFLEPKTGIVVPQFVMSMLKYAAPCLMISIAIPIVFFEHNVWKGISHNGYLYGAIFCILMTVITQKMLLSIMSSLLFFYGLLYLF